MSDDPLLFLQCQALSLNGRPDESLGVPPLNPVSGGECRRSQVARNYSFFVDATGTMMCA